MFAVDTSQSTCNVEDIYKQESPAVADKPARRETMRKSAAARRLNKLHDNFH